jgi:UDP-N-acetylmuramyl tripeptide synthase
MELVDCRRLTGPNLVWNEACAVLEAGLAPEEAERVIVEWQAQVRRMLDAIGWSAQSTRIQRCAGGAIFVLSAPADGQFVATEIAEWAWHAARSVLAGEEPPELGADAEAFRRVIAEEANPALIELSAAAKKHDVTFLADEERASVGLGTGVRSWPVRALPAVADVPWKGVHDIPVALVTGSHGKTTCVRLVAAIAAAAGKRAGSSTSASVTLGADVIERGDCADAESARDLVRERRVQVAILEAPRPELSRRGLPVPRAAAALITGAAEEASEEFGARTPDEQAEVMWIVARALEGRSPLVLNADDERLVAHAARVPHRPLVWYSLDPEHPLLAAHVERGGTAWTVREGMVAYLRGRQWRSIASVADIPVTLGGAARHNVANALAAAALAQALGLPERAIAQGLRTSSRDEHPASASSYTIDGVHVLADRAADAREMTAIAQLVAQLPGTRRALAFSAYGDQSDEALRALARAAWKMRPDRIFIDELPQHLRGRAPGAIAQLLREELQQLGAREEQISEHAREAATLDSALGWARPGDLVVMITLGDLGAVLDRLATLEQSKTERRA